MDRWPPHLKVDLRLLAPGEQVLHLPAGAAQVLVGEGLHGAAEGGVLLEQLLVQQTLPPPFLVLAADAADALGGEEEVERGLQRGNRGMSCVILHLLPTAYSTTVYITRGNSRKSGHLL